MKSIDESMVPCYGRHYCKQFILAKPVRFGYRLYVLASATGLPCNVEIYAGKSENDTGEPLATSVVKSTPEVCEGPSNHSLYFDNFFSSYQLLSELDKKGFRVTGTMRKDRAMKCPLIDMNEMKRKERGSYGYRRDEQIEIVQWNNNSVVTLESNAYRVNNRNR